MITHDEARIEAVSYNCESIRVILKYIAQQEKKDELLGLYRSVHGVVQSWDTMPDVEAKIQKLEKELKEGSK